MNIAPFVAATETGPSRPSSSSSSSSSTSASVRVWIDLDNAAGVGGTRDVDDALALMLARSLAPTHFRIAGVSTVFGNALMSDVQNATASWMRMLNMTVEPVAGAAEQCDEGAARAAAAMADALEEEAMDILAFGPLTNVAELVRSYPELLHRIRSVVFVGGRRPGHLFRIGTTNNETLCDMNFEKDSEAVRIVLESEVRLVLTGFEVSSKLKIVRGDVDRIVSASLQSSAKMANFIQGEAMAWLEFWQRTWQVDYFNPFDTLAVLYIATRSIPELNLTEIIQCDEDWRAWIRRASCKTDNINMDISSRHEGDARDHGYGAPSKLYFEVGPTSLSQSDSDEPLSTDNRVVFCHNIADPDALHQFLMDHLSRK